MEETIEERAEHNDPDALRLLGEKKLSEGDTAAAAKYLRLAVQLGSSAACFNLGKLYLLSGDEEHAQAIFREGKRCGDESCAYSLAELLLKSGDEEALLYITEYADADDEASMRLLADYYKTAGNNKQANYWKKRLEELAD